jgi:hypothetical protein
MAGLAIVLFLAAIFYPFRPSLEQGILGPLGQFLFFYLLLGWLFILLGVDPTGAGAVFSFFSPWPSLNVPLAIFVMFRPRHRFSRLLLAIAAILALFSCFVAWRLADAVSTIPLILWSAACIAAAGAIALPLVQREAPAE